MFKDNEIELMQKLWGDGIVNIGKIYIEGGDYKQAALDFVKDMYGYDYGEVLFKPTKAEKVQFRHTIEEATSYFVGGIVEEDRGFALKTWKSVRFAPNYTKFISDDIAIAMGNYYFIDKNDDEIIAEYTFGYKKVADGHPIIFLHHSSFPFKNIAK
ncbi:MAG: hypothetical protein Ta2D_11520 [Rickettsiales bacterium]|nr:MAG: hypothetical protein Ta2D_11520 [Rickettsiales bacterium]